MEQLNRIESNQELKASAALKVILGGTILYFGVIVTFAHLFVAML